jgi:hypothetical protein
MECPECGFNNGIDEIIYYSRKCPSCRALIEPCSRMTAVVETEARVNLLRQKVREIMRRQLSKKQDEE